MTTLGTEQNVHMQVDYRKNAVSICIISVLNTQNIKYPFAAINSNTSKLHSRYSRIRKKNVRGHNKFSCKQRKRTGQLHKARRTSDNDNVMPNLLSLARVKPKSLI